jgi:uncharacterized repeat protein (TIGR01451 family)
MTDGAGHTMPVGAREIAVATSLGSLSAATATLNSSGAASVNLTATTPGTAVITLTEWCGVAVTATVEFQGFDLSISKSNGRTTVLPEDILTYTLTITNSGNLTTTGIVLTDTLPVNTTFLTASHSGVLTSGIVTWPPFTVTAAGLTTRTVSVRVNYPLPTGVSSITNTATLTRPNDLTTTNNVAQDVDTVIFLPNMAITKTLVASAPSVGKVTTFTIEYRNLGYAPATGIVITDMLAANANYVTDTLGITPQLGAGTVRWTLPFSVAPGTGGSFLVGVNLDNIFCFGTVAFTNAVRIASLETDANSANNYFETAPVSIPCNVDLVVTKDDAIGAGWPRLVAAAGELITYTISLTNTGSQDAPAVVLTETLPANTLFVGPAGWSGGPSAYTRTLITMTAGSSQVFTFVVQVDPFIACAITQTTNLVSATSAGVEGYPADNSFSLTTPVQCNIAASLRVSKTDGLICAAPNQIITYTITYSNLASTAVTNAILTEFKPDYTNFLPGGVNTGWNLVSGSSYTRAIGTVNPGGPQGPVYYQVQVMGASALPTNVTSITNTVQISGGYSFSKVTSVPLTPDLAVAKNDNIGVTAASDPFMELYRQVTGSEAPPISAQADSVGPGDTIAYTIVYVNNGRATATGVVLTETLPLNTSYAGGPEWTGVTSQTYRYNVGTLTPGQGGFLTFRVQVNDPLPGGTAWLVNRVDIGGNESGQECNPANGFSIEQTPVFTITPPVGGPIYLPIIFKNVQPPSATLSWQNQANDRVQPVDGANAAAFTPDGLADGAFLLNLNPGSPARTVSSVQLQSTQSVSATWDTVPGNSVWVLGLYNGAARLNNADGSINTLVSSPVTVSLIGSDTDRPSRFTCGAYQYTVLVSFTDGSTASASATIPCSPPPTPTPPPQLLAYVSDAAADPDSNQIFIASPRHDSVYVINGSSDTLARTVPVSNGPTGLTAYKAGSAAQNSVWVAHQYGENNWDPGVRRFGVADSGSTGVGYVGAAPIKIAASAGYERVYVSNYYDKLAVLDTTGNLRGWVKQKAYQGAYGIDVSEATRRVYLASRDTGELVVFDGAGDRLLQDDYIPTHVKPPRACTLWSVAVNKTTGHVFVPCPGHSVVYVLQENQVSVLDELENLGTVEKRKGGLARVIAAAAAPWLAEINIPNGVRLGEEGIDIDPTTGRVFISNAYNNTVVILQDGSIPVYETTVPVGTTPQGVAVNPSTQKVYVGNTGSNNSDRVAGHPALRGSDHHPADAIGGAGIGYF